MIELILIVFILGYLFIALEHVVNINKAASALVTGVLCWTIFVLFSNTIPHHPAHMQEKKFLKYAP